MRTVPAEVLGSANSPEPRVRYALGLLGFLFGIVGLSAAVAGPISRAL